MEKPFDEEWMLTHGCIFGSVKLSLHLLMIEFKLESLFCHKIQGEVPL